VFDHRDHPSELGLDRLRAESDNTNEKSELANLRLFDDEEEPDELQILGRIPHEGACHRVDRRDRAKRRADPMGRSSRSDESSAVRLRERRESGAQLVGPDTTLFAVEPSVDCLATGQPTASPLGLCDQVRELLSLARLDDGHECFAPRQELGRET
jgi:hypothetical protein